MAIGTVNLTTPVYRIETRGFSEPEVSVRYYGLSILVDYFFPIYDCKVHPG